MQPSDHHDRTGGSVRVTVATFFYRHEAEVARSVLAANGIEALILADDAGGPTPNLQYVSGVRLIVHAGDAALAHEILANPRGAEGQTGDREED